MELSSERKVYWLITTLQEAFSAIIPYLLLTSFITLLLAFVRYYDIEFYVLNEHNIASLSTVLSLFSTVVIAISIAYFFAKRFQLSAIIAVTLAIAGYVTVMFIEESTKFFLLKYSYGFSVQSIFVPIVSTLLLKWFYPRFSLGIPLQDENIHIYRLFNYVFAFAMAYVATLFVYIVTDFAMDYLIDAFKKTVRLNLPTVVALMVRDFFIQIFWFMGIHGSHTVNAFFGKELLSVQIFPNLSVGEFNRLFVSIGGGGAGTAMLIAVLAYAKDRMLRRIAHISIPFVLFNINTLLTYAVVVFNRFLFIPFIFVPLFNIAFAYGALKMVDIAFSSHKVVWTTPIFVDSYIKTGGSLYVFAVQIFLLIVDTVIYMYFVKRFLESQSPQNQMQILEENLNIPYSIRANQNIESFIARREIIESNAKLTNIIRTINTDNMMIYFQPKIDLRANRCEHFEALLRHERNGEITIPDFLDLVEKARLAHVIDIWVAKEVKKALERWRESGFSPTININLHPDTLSNERALRGISGILHGEKVNFEIIERSFVQGEEAVAGLRELQKKGFGISIDDYGIGYSNMETILNHKISELKIDKGLIDRIEETNGAIVCQHIIDMCDSLGVDIVAEGVETAKQVEILKGMRVGYIQGFYFSRAMPFEKVIEFSRKFDINRWQSPIPKQKG